MKIHRGYLCILNLIFLSLIGVNKASATPVIGIGSMYDVLLPDSQSMTKRVYNTGESTAFVRVDILEINRASGKKADEAPQKEISNAVLEKNRLIVTPLRLIIPPGGFQTVRILWPGSREKEKYFRIRFTPVMPEADDSFGLNKEEVKDYRNKTLQAGINILTGYGTVLIVQPEKPGFKTSVSESLPDITVANGGNATISLDSVRQCKVANTDCGTVSREFILPGKKYSIEKKKGYTTSFTLIEGDKKRSYSF